MDLILSRSMTIAPLRKTRDWGSMVTTRPLWRMRTDDDLLLVGASMSGVAVSSKSVSLCDLQVRAAVAAKMFWNGVVLV